MPLCFPAGPWSLIASASQFLAHRSPSPAHPQTHSHGKGAISHPSPLLAQSQPAPWLWFFLRLFLFCTSDLSFTEASSHSDLVLGVKPTLCLCLSLSLLGLPLLPAFELVPTSLHSVCQWGKAGLLLELLFTFCSITGLLQGWRRTGTTAGKEEHLLHAATALPLGPLEEGEAG